MKNETKIIIALILAILLILSGRTVLLSEKIPESKIPEIKPAIQEISLQEGRTVDIETFVFYENDNQYADPFRYMRYLLKAPYVKGTTLLFEASSEGSENQYLVKAVGELSYILAYSKKSVNTRPVDLFRKILVQEGFLGTVSDPVIYFKTPNMGGKTTRIILVPGIIILESSNYEDIVTLALIVRQVVVG